jgi:ketosteroid isomerase-like protein
LDTANLQIARRMIESPVEAFFGCLDEQVILDARWWSDLPPDFPAVAVGREVVVKLYRRWWGTFDHYATWADELIDCGPVVVACMYEHGRGKTSGLPFERRHVQVWTFRDGRVVRIELFAALDEALAMLPHAPRPVGTSDTIAVVRDLLDAVARGDSATVLSLYDPDVVWDGTQSRWAEVLPGTESWQGHNGLRRFSRAYYEMWDDMQHEPEELVAAGDDVVASIRIRARGRGSGVEVEWPQNWSVWSVRDGRVVRVVWHRSRDEAFASVNLAAERPSD